MIACPEVKINLGLSVLRRREDSFHELETLFVPCSAFHDTLQIELSDSPETTLELEGASWDPSDDLTFKAYNLLKEEFDIPAVRMKLSKGNPVGAGLGGGSSDAACALKMLAGMFDLPLSDSELAQRAAKLGSDCAFFIYNRPMFARGRGEILSPYPIDLSAYRLEVRIPRGSAVSTREAYAGVFVRDSHPELNLMPLEQALKQPVSEWRECLVNDFERSVFPLHPEIAALKQEFYDSGAVYASMSGSGSAVFALFEK